MDISMDFEILNIMASFWKSFSFLFLIIVHPKPAKEATSVRMEGAGGGLKALPDSKEL